MLTQGEIYDTIGGYVLIECSSCKYGYISCEECNGVGDEYCDACGNSSDCFDCEGIGEVSCEDCGGTGEVEEVEEEEEEVTVC